MLSADGVRQIVRARSNVGVLWPERRLRNGQRAPQKTFRLTRPTLIGKERGKIGKLVGYVGMIRAKRPFHAAKASAIEYFGLRIAPLSHMQLTEVARDRRGGNAFTSEHGLLDSKALLELHLIVGQFALLLEYHGQIGERDRHIGMLSSQRRTHAVKGPLKKGFGLGIERLVMAQAR